MNSSTHTLTLFWLRACEAHLVASVSSAGDTGAGRGNCLSVATDPAKAGPCTDRRDRKGSQRHL